MSRKKSRYLGLTDSRVKAEVEKVTKSIYYYPAIKKANSTDTNILFTKSSLSWKFNG